LIAPARLRTVLVAMDFSPHAHAALAIAKRLARDAGPARVLLFTACSLPVDIEGLDIPEGTKVLDFLEKRATEELGRIAAGLASEGIEAEAIVQRGPTARLLLALAREKAVDLIALGTHGRSGVSLALLGSVAERVLRHAPCPVLVTKAEA
jgi:nucleotide-binding universal stress UspA family protein